MTIKANDPRVKRVNEVFEQERTRIGKLFNLDLSQVKPIIKERKSRILGQAQLFSMAPELSWVFINASYFHSLKNFQYICGQTITHELVHVANVMKHGTMVRAHGHEWKQMMVAAGKEPSRLAKDVDPHGQSRKASLIVAVQCACGETFYMSKRSWNKRERYTHKSCGKPLTLAKKIKDED